LSDDKLGVVVREEVDPKIISTVVGSFASLGVTEAMLQQYCERCFYAELKHLLPEDLKELRHIYTSIKEGEKTWSEVAPLNGYMFRDVKLKTKIDFAFFVDLCCHAWTSNPPATLPANREAIAAMLPEKDRGDFMEHATEILSLWIPRIDGRIEYPALSADYYAA
jgi:hypothetical protein